MSDAVGWGIVGLGRVAGEEIAPALTALDQCRLVSVVSRDRGRARQFADKHGAQSAYDDYADLLYDPDVNAVYIATPNALHAQQALAAAKAGKHVLCDKPLATTTSDARHVVAGCAAAGVQLGVMFQTRNHGGMAQVRDAVAAGEIGPVVVAQLEMGTGRTLLRGWRTDPALAGVGTMNNLGVHGYDLLRYLLGAEVTQATAFTGREPGFELETVALALLRFSNGALGYVNVNQAAYGPSADLSIYGTEGHVLGRGVTRMNMSGTLTIRGRSGERSYDVASYDAYRKTLSDFSDAVLRGRGPSPSGLDGLRSAELVEVLAAAARTGQASRLPA